MAERLFRGNIFKDEAQAVPIATVLSRFEGEAERQTGAISLDALLSRSLILSDAVNQAFGMRFEAKVLPGECPNYNLVLTGALFSGRTNPDEVVRFNQILCGHTVKDENSIGFAGPLSGGEGKNYEPLSQCWKVALEMARLVDFMNQVEETPDLPLAGAKEAEKLAILTTRAAVNTRNDHRQMVFVVWNELRKQMVECRARNGALILFGQTESTNDATLARILPVYDATAQLNVGGPEYQELTGWVNSMILDPLIKLVGDKKINVDFTREFSLSSLQQTAENCPKSPRAFFEGTLSLATSA